MWTFFIKMCYLSFVPVKTASIFYQTRTATLQFDACQPVKLQSIHSYEVAVTFDRQNQNQFIFESGWTFIASSKKSPQGVFQNCFLHKINNVFCGVTATLTFDRKILNQFFRESEWTSKQI